MFFEPCPLGPPIENYVLVSSNGMAWRRAWIEPKPGPIVDPCDVSEPIDAVGFGNGRYILTGASFSRTSSDGESWSERSPGGGLAIGYGGCRFVKVGRGGSIWTSEDSEAWVKRNSGTTNTLTAVAFGRRTFVAVGYQGTILQSAPVSPEPLRSPRWTENQVSADGNFRLELSGDPDICYGIEASTNLAEWVHHRDVRADAEGKIEFIDATGATSGRTFYRATAER